MRLRRGDRRIRRLLVRQPRHGQARVQELVAAQKALCHTGPLPLLPARSSGGRAH